MRKLKDKPQVLFKNSNNTINTYSKTCSAFSESVTKSIIMQLKKQIKNNNYYHDNGTIKRDLSIETDICILRRYLKENKYRLVNKNSSSARFKYSINNDKVEESKADTSACGDSQYTMENAQFKLDLTTLVVDNLKSLLNNWIKRYLLENNKTKQKIETVLDSILHKVEVEQTSSSGTYTLDVEIVNESEVIQSYAKKHSKKNTTKKLNKKISSQTVPLAKNRLKLISTLSVPKISSKYMKSQKNHLQINKTSVNKLLSNSSSYNVLEIRTESLTKRCATYQKLKWEKSSMQNKLNFQSLPSPTTISSVQTLSKNNENTHFKPFNEYEQSKEMNKLNVIKKQDLNTSLDASPVVNNPIIVAQYKKDDSKQNQRRVVKKRLVTLPSRNRNIKTKSFSYNCKKRTKQFNRHNTFLQHIENILRYFEGCKNIKDLNFNIHVNVSPATSREKKGEHVLDNIQSQDEIKNNQTFLYKVEHDGTIKSQGGLRESLDSKNIISILDGTRSQSKYLISHSSSINKLRLKGINLTNKNTGTSGLDIIQDFGEIKRIIRDLVSAAEHIVKEQLDKKNTALGEKCSNQGSAKSIGIQCVTAETRNVTISGLKLKKEPKKRESKDYNPRLTKTSTSYRIIESESLLKVHDLTALPRTIEAEKNIVKTGSLEKSQSLIDVSPPQKNKLLAFYCDNCIKTRQCMYDACNHNVPCANMYSTCCNDDYDNHVRIENCHNINCLENRQLMQCKNNNFCIIPHQTCCDENNDVEETTSLCPDIERTTCDKKFVVTKRRLGFKEGCLYCLCSCFIRMNSRINISGSKGISSFKYEQAYVVSFSHNVNESNYGAELHPETQNNFNNAINIGTKTNPILCSYVVNVIDEIIDNVVYGKSEIHKPQFQNDLKVDLDIPANSISIFKDIISSPYSSTDTIRNKSTTSGETLCNSVKSGLFEDSFHVNLKNEVTKVEGNTQLVLPTPLLNETLTEQIDNDDIRTNSILKIDIPPDLDQECRMSENVGDSQKDEIDDECELERESTKTPYKKDIINIALAQMSQNSIITAQNDKLDRVQNVSYRENILSCDLLLCHNPDLKTNDFMSNLYTENDWHENSGITLVGSVLSELSSRDDYFLADTGSSVNKTDNSVNSITSRSQNDSSVDGKDEQDSRDGNTVIISRVCPSTSYADQYLCTNNVVISDDIHKMYPLRSKGDHQSIDKFPKNLLKKSFEVEESEHFQKSVNLPNQAIIKEILTENQNSHKLSCSEESRNFQPFPDIWEKIANTLDLAIKRLEESLSEKILSELKGTLQKMEHFANQISMQKRNETSDINTVEIAAESNNEEGMQCNLIHSYAIDNLMFKLSEEVHSEKTGRTKILKIKDPKVLKDTFEVLKAYNKPPIPIGEGDSLKVSSEDATISTEPRSSLLLRAPMRFLRENGVVLGSVPAFFVYMLVVYGFIMLLVKG
ncbi:unnamed protein product [Leptosia nina]|uniref:Uncharacterized protein n=1 Tax=Leptosia nina TaxID=320188 RepID=A0AAV1JKG9_9NEOP